MQTVNHNHGRVIVPQLTGSGNLAASYGISGRSPGSKKRRMDVYPEEGRIYVGPLGEMTPQQVQFKDLIFYNCMRVRRDGNLLIVTNGAQTDAKEKEGKPVKNFHDDFDPQDPERSSVAIMEDWGYESDAFVKPWIGTPRTALVRYPNSDFCVSMVTKCGDKTIAKAADYCAGPGTGMGVAGKGLVMSTYVGNDEYAVPWCLEFQSFNRILMPIELEGETPEQLAGSLYRWMDPNYVSATAAAVLDGEKWELAAKNKWETEEEFLRDHQEVK